MKFAYSTNAFQRYSLLDTISMVANLGFDGIEIMADRPHLYPPDWGTGELTELKMRLEDLGLAISNLNTFTLQAVGDMHHPSWIEASEKDRLVRLQHTLGCLEFAALLDVPSISVQPGGRVEAFSPEKSMDIFLEGLGKTAKAAEGLGVKILVEPEPDLLIENSKQFEDFIERVDSPAVGLNLDVGHFACAGEDPAWVIERLAPWTCHVHIEDIKGRVHDHKIAGEGDIDFASVFGAFHKIGYHGFISIELYPYQDDPVGAGRKSLVHLKKFL
jgi:sugar phosphate isomerase/epimerase